MIALFVPAFEFFQEVPITDFLTGKDWSPLFEPAHFGVLPLVAGTLLVTGIASLVAMPLGLGSAIYLSEYASPRVAGHPEACASRSSRASRRSSSATSRSRS